MDDDLRSRIHQAIELARDEFYNVRFDNEDHRYTGFGDTREVSIAFSKEVGLMTGFKSSEVSGLLDTVRIVLMTEIERDGLKIATVPVFISGTPCKVAVVANWQARVSVHVLLHEEI